jgi:hypothetical protein
LSQETGTTAQPEKPEQEKEWYEGRIADFEPTEYRNGFTFKTLLGGLFLGVFMLPGSIYLFLMMGQSLGPAAEWTTVILFTEVARRSLTILRRQELFMIFYVAAVMAGGGMGALIWNQYLINSPAAENFGLQTLIPKWVAPRFGSEAYIQRSFLHLDWWLNSDYHGLLAILLAPIPLLLIGNVLGRMQWIGMGYLLFRSTSDVERLPFPFAYVQAQGATALAEVTEEKETWRWPVFSVGSMIGLIFGLFYVGIPAITSGFLPTPIRLIPMPFIDFTTNSESAFPTGMVAIDTNLGSFLGGFVIPFPVICGQFIMAIFSNFILSPTLYRMTYDQHLAHSTLFRHWSPGMNVIQTSMITNFDFWMSFQMGVSVAIALIGLWLVGTGIVRWRAQQAGLPQAQRRTMIPSGRGDFSNKLALLLWLVPTAFYVALCMIMVPRFPKYFFILFAFIWGPLNSYVSARLIGMIGRGVSIPYMHQAAFILSGYKGIDVWFIPMPREDYGFTAQQFRSIELTGTKFTSIIYAEIFIVVVGLACGFAYYSFYWKSSPIPSSQYPFVQTFWPLDAFNALLWPTATKPGGAEGRFLLEAVKWKVIATGASWSLLLYWILGAFKVQYFWFYGIAPAVGMPTTGAIPAFAGALVGRLYFAKRFGKINWFRYAVVIMAGYACGVGLIGMFSIAISIIFRAVRALPY